MKKLKLKENEVVHCATLKEAKNVLKIAHEFGFTCNEDNLNRWNRYKEDTCYNFNSGTCISYAEKDFYMYDEDFLCKVITSKEFIKRHKKTSLKKRIKALEAIVNGKSESSAIIKSRESQYPKGWYKSTVKGNKAFIYFNGYDFLYGINYNGVWENESFVQEDRKLKAIDGGVVVKATNGEVVHRLIGEATKRGFKGKFEFINNTLYCNELLVFFDGKWSENEITEETYKEIKQPQIGDVVKAWDDDKSKFVYGVYNGREEYEGYYIVGEVWHENIEKVTEISINDFKK